MDWKEWLTHGVPFGMDRIESTPLLLSVALVGSLATSFLVSFLYVRFYGTRATGSQVHRSFMLLGPSITAIFIAIQFSLPLSLGLLGALSIVRFRTPIKEAEEIGFILLVVAVSLSWATLNLQLLAILLGVAVVGLLIVAGWTWRTGGSQGGMIVVTMPAADFTRKSKELLNALEGGLRRGKLDSISENDDQSVVSYTFSRLDKDRLLELRQEVSRIAERASVNLFFHHSGQV
jgi:hypothetical protein